MRLDGGKIGTSFKSIEIDNLLGVIHRSIKEVNDVAENLRDLRDLESSRLITETNKATIAIWEISKDHGKEVEELRSKVDEILEGQRWLQAQLGGVSAQNAVYQFLRGSLGKSKCLV